MRSCPTKTHALMTSFGTRSDADFALSHPGRRMSTAEFSIIGIGASAGGIDAFHSFFDHMPPDSGMAFVMILHLPSDRKSMLTEILTRWTPMPVLEVMDRVAIQPNHVYVPPPHAIVTLIEGHLVVEMPTTGS